LGKRWALKFLVDERFSGLKHFWTAAVVDRPKNLKRFNENVELYKPEGEFSNEEKIENLVSLTGIFPMDLVINDNMLQDLKHHQIPALGKWDNDLGVAWFIPREVIEKKTKNGKPYWIIRTIDNTSTFSSIKCWGVDSRRDIIHLNRPYMSRLDYNEQWGFSTRSIKYNFRLLG